MAFALLSIFEPSIVQKIHELAKKPDTFEVKLIYYTDPWDHASALEITIPTESEDHRLQLGRFPRPGGDGCATVCQSALAQEVRGGWRRRKCAGVP